MSEARQHFVNYRSLYRRDYCFLGTTSSLSLYVLVYKMALVTSTADLLWGMGKMTHV